MTDTERLQRLADLAEHFDWLRQERDIELRRLAREGHPVAALAELAGITRQRAYQIIEEGKAS